MYCNTSFRLSPEEEIVSDLKELSRYANRIDRIFLLNGDPFVLPTDKLLRIAELIHEYLPNVSTITCYSSINDLRNKSLKDLKELRAAGYNELYIGLETGYGPALEQMRKGYTSKEAEHYLGLLQNAGFDYHALLMGGIGGRAYTEEATKATAELLNAFPPKMIALLSTSVQPGTELATMRDSGEYEELTERELIEEEIQLLEQLDLPGDTMFNANHVLDLIPISAPLSKKEEVIAYLREGMSHIPSEYLDRVNARMAG